MYGKVDAFLYGNVVGRTPIGLMDISGEKRRWNEAMVDM